MKKVIKRVLKKCTGSSSSSLMGFETAPEKPSQEQTSRFLSEPLALFSLVKGLPQVEVARARSRYGVLHFAPCSNARAHALRRHAPLQFKAPIPLSPFVCTGEQAGGNSTNLRCVQRNI